MNEEKAKTIAKMVGGKAHRNKDGVWVVALSRGKQLTVFTDHGINYYASKRDWASWEKSPLAAVFWDEKDPALTPEYLINDAREEKATLNKQAEETAPNKKEVKSMATKLIPHGERPENLNGTTIVTPIYCGELYVTLNSHPEYGLSEVFLRLGKSGSCAASHLEALARSINYALDRGLDIEGILEGMKGIRCGNDSITGGVTYLSCADTVAKVIEGVLPKLSKTKTKEQPPETPAPVQIEKPRASGRENMLFEAGQTEIVANRKGPGRHLTGVISGVSYIGFFGTEENNKTKIDWKIDINRVIWSASKPEENAGSSRPAAAVPLFKSGKQKRIGQTEIVTNKDGKGKHLVGMINGLPYIGFFGRQQQNKIYWYLDLKRMIYMANRPKTPARSNGTTNKC